MQIPLVVTLSLVATVAAWSPIQAQQGTDIYVADLSVENGRLVLGPLTNAT